MIRTAFEAAYLASFGRLLAGLPIRIVSLRVAAIGRRPPFAFSVFAPEASASLDAARREILGLEPQIRELVRTEKRLTAASRQAAGDYLSKGFEVLRDDGKFAREITEKCRK